MVWVIRVVPKTDIVGSYLIGVEEAMVQLLAIVETFVDNKYDGLTRDGVIPCCCARDNGHIEDGFIGGVVRIIVSRAMGVMAYDEILSQTAGVGIRVTLISGNSVGSWLNGLLGNRTDTTNGSEC